MIDALHAAQRASLPGRSRERVLETTAALLRSARGAGAPELAAALTWHLGENVNFACGEYAWTAEARCTASARVRAGTDTKRLGVGVGDDTGSECFSAEKEGWGAAATARGARRRSPPRWPAWRAPR